MTVCTSLTVVELILLQKQWRLKCMLIIEVGVKINVFIVV
jgi:hypothetical protein